MLPIFLPMSGGTFVMGSAKIEPGRDPDEDEHQRTVHAFWIANVEVTQQLYTLVTRHNPSPDKHPLKPIASITWWSQSFLQSLSSLLEYDPVYRDLDTSTPSADMSKMAFDCPQKPSGRDGKTSHHRYPPIKNRQLDYSTHQSTKSTPAVGSWKCLGDVLGFIHSLP